jgi:hypothetical protein
MESREGWPVWGQLIEEARDRRKISQNEAATRVPMSGTRWRQVVKGEAGEMTSTRGVRTLAKMALVVGLSSKRLAEIGRTDVADELRREGHADVPPDDLETLMQDPEARAALRTIIRRIRGDERPRSNRPECDEEAG